MTKTVTVRPRLELRVGVRVAKNGVAKKTTGLPHMEFQAGIWPRRRLGALIWGCREGCGKEESGRFSHEVLGEGCGKEDDGRLSHGVPGRDMAKKKTGRPHMGCRKGCGKKDDSTSSHGASWRDMTKRKTRRSHMEL